MTQREVRNAHPYFMYDAIHQQPQAVAHMFEAHSHLAEELAAQGCPLQYLDAGGGLAIRYREERLATPADLAAVLAPAVERLGVTLVLEPGRSIVGPAGVLLTRVRYRKETEAKRFVIVDAGMNDLLRPSLYQAYHEIRPVQEPSSAGGEGAGGS